MEAFIVRGGRALRGAVRVSGAKNSALKVAAAALLAEGRTVIRNVPDIADMHVMTSVLEHLGVTVTVGAGAYALDVPGELGRSTPENLARRLRASIVVLGPLLAREGRVRLAMPGGCNLGNRGIDMHLSGLTQMGAEIAYGPDYVEARADRLRGAHIELPFASVGATENLLMAAVTAAGTTSITNAAREPEIFDLVAFLSGMGADIEGAGTAELVVRGVDRLSPCEHEVLPDRIEAGTYAVAAAVTQGEVTLEGVEPGHLRLPLDKLSAIGAEVEERERTLVVRGTPTRRAVDVVTLPYPGFPTDLQPQFLVLLSQAAGTSMVTENVYDGRFSIISELHRLGADIVVEGHHAIVRGTRRLSGTTVTAPDLRAGAALVLAGLVADGETVVRGAGHVDRGYTDLSVKLRSLGADIERTCIDDAGLAAGAA